MPTEPIPAAPSVGRLRLKLHMLKRRLLLSGKRPAQIFDEIYRKNTWEDDESVSGHGSRLDRTTHIRAALPALLRRRAWQSLLDIPCGDFNWMKTLDLNVDYIGADIVPDLVRRNQEQYGGPRRKFITLDLLRDRLPGVDVVLRRDCLVHFSNSDILTALKNIRASGSQYLLTTTFPERRQNQAIVTGEWRPVNLCLRPFRLPAPAELLDDTFDALNYREKYLGLWKVTDLPS